MNINHTPSAHFQPDRCTDCMVGQGDACKCRAEEEIPLDADTTWELIAVVVALCILTSCAVWAVRAWA